MTTTTEQPELNHAPNCSDHEGTSTVHGHTCTIVKCLNCGAIATKRHMGGTR